MTNQKTLSFRKRIALRQKLARGENRKLLVNELIGEGLHPIAAENEVLFQHVRLKNPLGNFLFHLVAIYILTVSITACAFLYFGDIKMVLLSSIISSLFALAFMTSSPNSDSDYSSIGFVTLRWLAYAILLTASIALILTEDWDLGARPNDKHIIIWGILYAAMFIGLKLIGVIVFILVHISILSFYHKLRLAFIQEEAQRQRNNYMLLLASQLSLKLKLPFEKSLELGKKVMDSLNGYSPLKAIQVDFENYPPIRVHLEDESLSLGVLNNQSELIEALTPLTEKSWKWRIKIPSTPYFY
ncbi:hypothetical protein [Pseudidiomarina woesei]|uniref:Uncharacterized protein n=1 Tax=Pseudidiomarina woesei TaxID=1381080 RepID=A0A0K6H563_9GAMM|nr:hypothetical protein [Pseudidiomarina woesei]CUA85880.1 hypothetical protein Ga0061064_1342 [Pseudidiomarina woesei]